MSDSAGALVNRFVPDAFGNYWSQEYFTNPIVLPEYGLQSKVADGGTGLYYFGARWYDAERGRWLSQEPLGFIDGPNLYAFVLNDPYAFVDPNGLESDPFEGIGAFRSQYYNTGETYYFFDTVYNSGELACEMAAGLTPVPEEYLLSGAVVLKGGTAFGRFFGKVKRLFRRAPRGLPFQSGDMWGFELQSSKGPIGILAETVVDGKTLTLKDIAVFPNNAARLNIGPREVMRLRDQLSNRVRTLGFKELIITGQRISGARPGKEVRLVIDLTE